MHGLPGHIGRLNCNTVPTPEKMDDELHLSNCLANFLNTLVVIKQGTVNRDRPTVTGVGKHPTIRTNNTIKEGHIPIYDKDGKLQTSLHPTTFHTLYNDYMNNHHIKQKTMTDFDYQLRKMLTGHKLTMSSAPWKLHESMLRNCQKHFNLQAQRIASPLTHHPNYKVYYSNKPEDTAFGANTHLTSTKWSLNGLLNCIVDTHKATYTHLISQAIGAAQEHKTTTLLLIPLRRRTRIHNSYMRLLTHNTVHPIATWNAHEVKLVKSSDPDITCTVKDKVGMFIICDSPIHNLHTHAQWLKELSTKLYGCTPELDPAIITKTLQSNSNNSYIWIPRHNYSFKETEPRKNPHKYKHRPPISRYILEKALHALEVDNTPKLMKILMNHIIDTGREHHLKSATTETQVLTVKRQLRGLVVSALDKHRSQLYVQ